MNNITTLRYYCLLSLFTAAAIAAPPIGLVTGTGTFTLGGASHQNNATVFEGNAFDSGSSELEFRLDGGTTVHLGTSTRGTIYRDHIFLKEGGGDFRPSPAYSVEALNMRVRAAKSGAVARVVIAGGQVRVGALRGELQVSNQKGVLLATINQGSADSFTPQALGGTTVSSAGAAAAAGAAGTAGAIAASAGAVAAGTATAAGISTGVIVAGVAIAGAGAAAGLELGTSTGSGDATLSPSAR